MSAEYCPECEGDPRRRANVERHKNHTPIPTEPQKIPTEQNKEAIDEP